MTKPEEVGKQMLEAVKSYVARAVAPLAARFDAWEKERPLDQERMNKAIADAIARIPPLPPVEIDYELINANIAKTAEELISKIELPPGPAGKDGRDGIDGKDGESIKGDRGEPGSSIKGDQGEKGDPGEPGEKGITGDPGRDAAELDILPSIDETKSYRRGTWASHNGGLIKAERQTDPVTDGLIKAGWSVMVEGVSAIVVTQADDPRELEVATMLTSGTKAIASFRVPLPIYRGTWREGPYAKGDQTTWDGSQWHSEIDGNTDKPGTTPNWKMCVRKGQNGKDGKDGDRGGEGKEGRAGRDLTQMLPNGQKY